MKHLPRIVITGGHLTPALALIEILQKEKWQIYYFGRTKAMQGDKQLSLEAKIIPQKGIKFIPLITGRFRRRFSIPNTISLLKIPIGIIHALIQLIKIQPNIVISFGGYLGLPTIIAARILKTPSIIHEQTSTTGLANKISSSFATKIAISFPTSQKYYPKQKTTLTGNPIMSSVFKSKHQTKLKYTKDFTHPHTIFVTGGNQGARDLNRLILKSLPKLLKKYNIIHQIGSTEAQLPEWKQAQQLANKNYLPVRFIPHQEMGTIYSLSRLVISRSGANTISELGALNKSAITIPLEPSLMNEQLQNAKLFQTSGLGKLLHEKQLSTNTLIKQINNILKHPQQFKLQTKYKNLFPKKGANNLYQLIIKTTKQPTHLDG